ncbi:glycosyl transferase group 1 [Chitinispirillum alkaliphilum]|nr:glycosyl transferase group 1 [Chitinispirillum alkaliphilum]
MKKIVFVTTLPQTVFFLLGEHIEYLKAKGYSVEVITSKGIWLNSDQIAEKFNIPVHTVSFTRTITPVKDLKCMFKLIILFLKLRPDILHVSTPKASILAIVAAFLTGVKNRIYTVRGLVYLSPKNKVLPVMFLIEFIACRLATKVLAVSDSNRKLLFKHKLCNSKKIEVLGNGSSHGVDASERFNPARFEKERVATFRESIGLRKNSVVFGFVGRLVKDKGIEDFACAWEMFTKKYSDAELVIIGPSVEPRDCISNECFEFLKLRKDVHFFFDITDPVEYYTVMDVFVLPSYREGFPNVVLEAGAMCVPVITSNAPGCIDSVLDNETGLITSVGDPALLCQKMEILYSNPHLRKQFGDNARKRALELFSPELICNLQEKLYRELI